MRIRIPAFVTHNTLRTFARPRWPDDSVYTRSMTRGRLAGVVVAVAIAAVLGVLVASRGAGSPVAAAATKTSEQSAHLTFSLSFQGPKLAGPVQVSGSGTVDGTSADITVQDSGAPAAVPTALHAILVRQSGDELAFVHLTPMPSFAGGKRWVEVDLSKLASSHGLDLGSLAAGASAMTPAQVLDLLRGAGATVTSLGSATVDGASTTHYRVLVDADEIAKVAGLPARLTDHLGRHGTKQLPVDVWIGTDGLVHRVALDLRGRARALSFTATLGDYGADASIAPPPSSDVLDVTSFLTGASGMQPLS